MSKRDEFLRKTDNFFQLDLLKEIYFNENFSLLNVANGFYVIALYSDKPEQDVFVVSASFAELIVKDNSAFYNYVLGLSNEEFKKRYIVFNDKTFEAIKKLKSNTDMNGPNPNIDSEFEESLKAATFGGK